MNYTLIRTAAKIESDVSLIFLIRPVNEDICQRKNVAKSGVITSILFVMFINVASPDVDRGGGIYGLYCGDNTINNFKIMVIQRLSALNRESAFDTILVNRIHNFSNCFICKFITVIFIPSFWIMTARTMMRTTTGEEGQKETRTRNNIIVDNTTIFHCSISPTCFTLSFTSSCLA